MKWTVRIVAALVVIVGLVLAMQAYRAWSDYQSYTVEAEAFVKSRTPTSAVVRIEGKIPGGNAVDEIGYGHLIGGHGNELPPANAFQVGDKVTVWHPPGRPERARLAEGFGPSLPPWLGWVGAAMMVVGGLVLAVALRSSAERSPAAPAKQR